MPKLIRKLVLESVDVVPRGANEAAMIALRKMDFDGGLTVPTIERILKSANGGWTRDDVATAIEQKVSKMADEKDVKFSEMYHRYMMSNEGERAFQAYEAARLDTVEELRKRHSGPVAEPDGDEQSTCPKCGAVLKEGWDYCAKCGGKAH